MVWAPNLFPFITIEKMERLFKVDRLEMMYKFCVYIMLIFEGVWLVEFINILRYNDSLNEIVIHFIEYDYRRIPSRIQTSLVRKFVRRSFISGSVYRISFYFNFIQPLMILVQSYMMSEIGPNQFVYNVLFAFISSEYIRITSGILFALMFCYFFMIQFLKIKLQYLMDKIYLFCNNRINLRLRFLPRKFSEEYNEIYYEIEKFNQTAKKYFFFMEVITKTGVIFYLIFQRHQNSSNVFNMMTMIIIISVFLLENFLYSQVTALPDHNRYIFRCLTSWNARTQFHHQITRRSNAKNYIFLTNKIKSNLFIQSVIECPMGLRCGPAYFIEKLRHLEISSLTFVFVILIYKKFIWNMKPQ
ncbi:hypothetical protein SSS_09671 [Sarcoptes scabiei]|uniref:Gustatory receptor n=1 Tax=Sarcoptes scabiei TaxID=52283 RepID=A0A834VIW7_SARSC|nr:hypothetical protein SSS_09671 [Sarcoptes scabiei]